MAVDRFQIPSFFRFMLIFRVLAPLAFFGIVLWAISGPYIGLSKWGPLVLVGLAGWGVWEFVKLCQWYTFSVELSDEGITISGEALQWSDLAHGRAKTAMQFDTFIELTTKEGRTFKIPACIQQSSFVLAKIEKHFPEIEKEA